MLKFSKKKAFSDSIILNSESYNILLKYLDLYTKEIQNQVIYQNLFSDLDGYIFNYKELEKGIRLLRLVLFFVYAKFLII